MRSRLHSRYAVAREWHVCASVSMKQCEVACKGAALPREAGGTKKETAHNGGCVAMTRGDEHCEGLENCEGIV